MAAPPTPPDSADFEIKDGDEARLNRRALIAGCLGTASCVGAVALAAGPGWALVSVIYGGALSAIVVLIARSLTPTNRRLNRYANALRAYEAALREYRLTTLSYWTSLRGRAFEIELAQLFRRLGHEATVTRASGDEGVDILVTRDNGASTIVQCKAYAKKIGPAVARELLGTMNAGGAHQAILAAPGGLTQGALDFCRRHGIDVLDGQGIVALVESCERRDGLPTSS
jgi:Restriction endonuclease